MNRAETERVYIDLKFAQAKLATTAVKIRSALDSGMPRAHRDDYLREARYWLGEAMMATGRAEHRLGLHTTLEPRDDVDYHSRIDDVAAIRAMERAGAWLASRKPEDCELVSAERAEQLQPSITEAGEMYESARTYPGNVERTTRCKIVPMPDRSSRDPDAVDVRLLVRREYGSMWSDFREWLYDWWWLRVRRSPSRGIVIGYRKAEREAQRKGRP